MSTSSLTLLNQRLSSRPEAVREHLAQYICDHLDVIEFEMNWQPSEELKAELERREKDCYENPSDGAPWPEVRERILKSRK
ncbi:MAG: hypothetical protein JO314_07665 [Acidobacteria bacterium]|nr:hypothetical protein [Acidobacteriota bacterium]